MSTVKSFRFDEKYVSMINYLELNYGCDFKDILCKFIKKEYYFYRYNQEINYFVNDVQSNFESKYYSDYISAIDDLINDKSCKYSDNAFIDEVFVNF